VPQLTSVSFRFFPVLSVSFRFIPFLSVSFRFIPFLSVSFRFFPFLSVSLFGATGKYSGDFSLQMPYSFRQSYCLAGVSNSERLYIYTNETPKGTPGIKARHLCHHELFLAVVPFDLCIQLRNRKTTKNKNACKNYI
jgi:hypothetical protein